MFSYKELKKQINKYPQAFRWNTHAINVALKENRITSKQYSDLLLLISEKPQKLKEIYIRGHHLGFLHKFIHNGGKQEIKDNVYGKDFWLHLRELMTEIITNPNLIIHLIDTLDSVCDGCKFRFIGKHNFFETLHDEDGKPILDRNGNWQMDMDYIESDEFFDDKLIKEVQEIIDRKDNSDCTIDSNGNDRKCIERIGLNLDSTIKSKELVEILKNIPKDQII